MRSRIRHAVYEQLESRLALATVSFTDVDGDLVTVTSSRGSQSALETALVRIASGVGQQLRSVNLQAAEFTGTNLTITATPVGNGQGDGVVHVGQIDAESNTLGAVSVDGDLGRIWAGISIPGSVAITSLMVRSLGRYGLTTGAIDLQSSINGRVDTLRVAGDVVDVFLNLTGTIRVLSIGGSLVGGSADDSGVLQISAPVQRLEIGGSIRGGAGAASAFIDADTVSFFKVGGDVWGGAGAYSACVNAIRIGTLLIGGSIVGGGDSYAGSFEVIESLGSCTIRGDLVGTAARTGFIGGSMIQIGSVTIGGDLAGGYGVSSGAVAIDGGTIGSVTIRGSLFGGSAMDSGLVSSTYAIGKVTVGGDVVGGAGERSGSVRVRSDDTAFNAVGSVTVGGSLRGGTGLNSGQIDAAKRIESVTVKGAVRGGGGEQSGSILSGASGTITIGGGVVGGDGRRSGMIGPLVAAVGGHGTSRVTIGGSLVGGGGEESGRVIAGIRGLRTLTIAGSLVGGFGIRSGGVLVLDDVTPVTITIGGSLLSGPGLSSGAVQAGRIDKLAVTRGIRGTATRPVAITAASGDQDAPAIASLEVGGRVERCLVQTTAVDPSGRNGGIGRITIRGDMIATSVVSAASNTLGIYGNLQDAWLNGMVSSIGSVTVGGQIVGTDGFETFGIVARAIGSVKHAGGSLTVPAAGVLNRIGRSNASLHRLP